MSETESKEILDRVKHLDGEQQAEVFRKLRLLLLPPSAASFAGFDPANRGKPPAGNVFACPRCNKPTLIRNGVYYPKNAYGFTQRFLCKECRATFSDQPDRTLIKKTDRECLEKFFFLMLDGVCLRQIARTLRIPHGRSFFLQYTILAALRKLEIPPSL